MKARIFALIAAFLPQIVVAEVKNSKDIYDPSKVCAAYLAFLDGKAVRDSSSCQRIESYLIEARGFRPTDFLTKYQTLSTTSISSVVLMARTQLAVIWSNPTQAYTFADVADRLIFSTLTSGGDDERASLYSGLLSGIQVDAVQALCTHDDCGELVRYIEPSDVLGQGFDYLDDVRGDLVLYCLLRTDAFSLPIRDVLSSQEFSACLKT